MMKFTMPGAAGRLSALCLLATAGAALADVHTALDPNPYSVIRAEAVAPFFAAATARRVDMAIIGDSNTRFLSISGHEDGMGRAFAARYGCYGTRVDPAGGYDGWAAQILDSNCVQEPWTTVGAPRELLSTCLPNLCGFPDSYAYIPTGAVLGYGNNAGIGILPSQPMDITGPLRWHMTYYRFLQVAQAAPLRRPGDPEPAPVPGHFSATCRELWPGSAWHNYASANVVTTTQFNPGFTDWSMDVPAGERSQNGVLFCLTNRVTEAEGIAVGPFFARWTRVENLNRQTGLAYSPLLYQGGQTARDAAISLAYRASQEQIIEWLRQVTRLQNGSPTLLIQIIQGANDANWDLPAFVYQRGQEPQALENWLVGAPTNTHAGIKQNFMSVINRLRDCWAAAGYDEANLYFLIGCYHPHPPSWNESAQGANDGLQYVRIREEAIPAWREICAENTNIAMVDGFKLSSPEEFIANGWYRFTSPFYNDHAHLSIAGYHAWGEAVAEAVTRACNCGPSVDADFDGDRDISDIFAYLSLWFAGDPRANFDQQGAAPTVPDIFAFLSAWFAGCAGH